MSGIVKSMFEVSERIFLLELLRNSGIKDIIEIATNDCPINKKKNSC